MKVKQTVQRFWRAPMTRFAAGVVVVFVVFSAGVGVGDGSLRFGRQNPNGLPTTLDFASVNKVYRALKENYDGKLTEDQLLNGLKHGLANATNDPYTVFFTAAEAQSFNNQLNNTFSGIGAELGENAQGNIQVVAPIDGMPAANAGIRAQDVIATINGKSTQGMSVEDAVTAIRGKAGTTVTLQIVRGKDAQAPLTFTITRANVQVPSVTTKTLDGNIGYVSISTFGNDTGNLVNQAAQKFSQAGVKGVILDLRDNPGGEVDAAVTTSSQWLPAGTTIMQEKRSNTGQVLQSYQSTGTNLLGNTPTVVLVNGGSASASEITTAALHDNNKAHVIGTKSYGKGVVQQLISFNDGSQLKVTIASWYRPNGKNINHLGITPDQVVNLTDDDIANGNDTQLQAAQAYLAQHAN